MSLTFTKLFSSITESTVWCEPAHTRLVWITMLAMADRQGRVWASIPGLANRARVPVEDTEKALETFLAPDKYSRTEDFEGRRIEPIDGGWRLLNYEKYRAIRDIETTREVAREHMRRKRASVDETNQQLISVDRGSHNAEAEAEASKVKSTVGLRPTLPAALKTERAKQAVEVIAFLNEKAGKNYTTAKVNVDLIVGLLAGGVSVDDIRSVVAKKVREWKGKPEMENYLRPATLFGPKNFHSKYHGELVAK